MKKKLSGLKGENVSLRWFRGNFNDKVAALEADVVSATKAVAESAKQNVTQIGQPVESVFSEHWK